MAEHVQATYRAILIPDHRVTPAHVDTADSSYTQAGPQPGEPVPQTVAGAPGAEMVLVSSGSQSQAGSLDVRIQRGGYPGLGDGAGIAWKASADASTGWRGWDPPAVITAWECIDRQVGGANSNTNPCLLTLPDDQVLVAFGDPSARIMCRRRSTAGVWGAEVQIDQDDYTGIVVRLPNPALVLLPSGRILCFYFWSQAQAVYLQIRMSYSDDSGTTWAVGGSYVLDTPIDDTTEEAVRLRAAYSGGWILLLAYMVVPASWGDDIITQWASDDLGASFTRIETQTAAAAASSSGYPDCVGVDGGFVTVYAPKDDQRPTSRFISSAFQPLSTATAVEIDTVVCATVAANVFTDGDLCCCVDEAGNVYALWRAPATGNCKAAVTYDQGATWTILNQTTGLTGMAWCYTTDAATAPSYLHACFQRGRILVAHNWLANPGDEDISLGIAYLGGYSTLNLPPLSRFRSLTQMVAWRRNWLPWDEPQDCGWTAAGVAAVEDLIAPQVLDLHTAAGNTRTYTRTADVSTIAEGWIAFGEWSVTVGEAGISLYLDDGAANDYEIQVRLEPTALRLWDVNAGAEIANAATVSGTKYQVIVALAAGAVTAWYRVASTGEDREWTLLGQDLTCVNGGGGAGAEHVRFGVLNAGETESEWVHVAYTYGAYTGDPRLAQGFSNPADLNARPISSLPVYVEDGVRIAATDGPGYVGEEWAIDARYDYPIENIYPHIAPSPQDVWRSTSTAADQTVAWAFHAQAGQGEDWPSDLLGIWYDGNSQKIVVETEATPGAGWVIRAQPDLDIAVDWTRAGESLELVYAAAAPQTLIVEEDEYVGCTIYLDLARTIARKIVRNTGGVLQPSGAGTYRRPRLYCDDLVVGDGASGAGLLCPRRKLIVLSLAGLTFSGLRVQLGESTRPPADVYFECGSLLVGPVYVLGHDPSRTRARDWSSNTALDTDRSGRRRSQVYGPVRERHQLVWTEGIDQKALMAGTADYILASDIASAEPVAMRRDSVQALVGLHRYLDGPGKLAVYIPRLEHVISSPQRNIKGRAGGARLVRVVSDVTVQTLRGTEEQDEVLRCAVTVEEEV